MDINKAISISIYFIKGLANYLLPEIVHRSSDDSHEFIIINSTISVPIKCIEECKNFLVGKVKHLLFHGLSEFLLIQWSAVIIVKDFELFAHTNEASSTSAGKLCLDLSKDFVDVKTAVLGCDYWLVS